MKNLNYITCNELNEYDLIAQSKHNPTRTNLTGLRASVWVHYNNYLTNFVTIANIPNSTYSGQDAADLRGCYGSKTIARDSLIKRIIDEQTVDFQEICPYCLYYLRTTIDHYIPQEDYSEFSVLAKNLLPCCSDCNTTKNRYWRANNKRLFLHLYNDVLPNQRFLFGSLSFKNSLPVIKFTINNNNQLIDANLFEIIKSHFNKLLLCDLYSEGISRAISDIHTDIKALRRVFIGIPTVNTFQDFLLAKSADLKIRYGINYWKAIAIDILANSNQFLNTL